MEEVRDAAEYIPLGRDTEPPAAEDFADAHMYFIDFCYPQELMDAYVASAKAVTVLDHHEGMESVIKSMPEYRYTTEHSGSVNFLAVLPPTRAYAYLLAYIEQGDLYRFGLPNTEQILTYAYTLPHSFSAWENLAHELENPEQFERIRVLGEQFAEHKNIIVQQIMKQAELVEFEGYRCYLASCSKQFTSPVGNKLSQKLPPLALVASVHAWGLRVSLRSDGTVDISEFARKYGGKRPSVCRGVFTQMEGRNTMEATARNRFGGGMNLLAIETSCDETAIAVREGHARAGQWRIRRRARECAALAGRHP